MFWEGHKIFWYLHQLFDWQYIGQIIRGDFAKFCGLLRIYELYKRLQWFWFSKFSCDKIIHYFLKVYYRAFYVTIIFFWLVCVFWVWKKHGVDLSTPMFYWCFYYNKDEAENEWRILFMRKRMLSKELPSHNGTKVFFENSIWYSISYSNVLKSIHYKRHAFWIFTHPKSNTFVDIIQNIIGTAGIWTHDQQIRSRSS